MWVLRSNSAQGSFLGGWGIAVPGINLGLNCVLCLGLFLSLCLEVAPEHFVVLLCWQNIVETIFTYICMQCS